jgi:hypothetical protein
MAFVFKVFMTQVPRSLEERHVVGDDFHLLYITAMVKRIVQGSAAPPWLFQLLDGDGNPFSVSEGEVVSIRARSITHLGDEIRIVEKEMTAVEEEDSTFRLDWDEEDFEYAGFYLAEILVSDDYYSEMVAPKKLRIEVIESMRS